MPAQLSHAAVSQEPQVTLFDIDNLGTLRPWLLGHVCPFWLTRIRDPRGGFFETLDPDGHPIREERRATLSQARLTYVFSHAAHLGGDATFADAARHGLAFLTRACAAPDGGWYRAVSVSGDVLDATRDCYDQAFVLFALAWFHRATGDAAAIGLADKTWAFMQARLSDPTHGGFQEEFTPGRTGIKLPRRQNPHMHLLEALLALHATTGDRVWLDRAADLIALFKARFTDPATGALIEYFAADWAPATGEPGRWREPGHQFEWVWLLFEYHRATGDASVIPAAERLFAFGSRFGIERDEGLQGAVLDGVDADGGVLAPTKLLWPQTEYLKACVARAEWLGDEAARQAIRHHLALIGRHFLRADGASWHNQLARDGTPIPPTTPARLLYHLFLAIAEVDRLLRLS